MKSLYQEIRTTQNLTDAWRHVKRSALSSANGKIRGDASQFEHRHPKHLRRIQEQLRNNSFNFGKSEGILKDSKKRLKQGKSPRPIVISNIESRIVQRAILQVLQPRTTLDVKKVDSAQVTTTDERLGKVNDINRSPYGVGGLLGRYGGSTPAIKLIQNAMSNGRPYFFQSDIKSFFTAIPIEPVLEFLKRETGDELLVDIVKAGLQVELEDNKSLKGYEHLFPSGGIGVAQGSSLSAFAGNVLLFDIDQAVNSADVIVVRYIDDVLMIASTEIALDAAILKYTQVIEKMGLEFYKPVPGSNKAKRGKCSDGFQFLGYQCQPSNFSPHQKAREKLKKDVMDILSNSRQAITRHLQGNKILTSSHAKAQSLERIQKKLYGWRRSFPLTTDVGVLNEIDDWIATKVSDYDNYITRIISNESKSTKAQVLGVAKISAPFEPPSFELSETHPFVSMQKSLCAKFQTSDT